MWIIEASNEEGEAPRSTPLSRHALLSRVNAAESDVRRRKPHERLCRSGAFPGEHVSFEARGGSERNAAAHRSNPKRERLRGVGGVCGGGGFGGHEGELAENI